MSFFSNNCVIIFAAGEPITKEFITSRTVVNCIPAWVRFAQCLRRYRDSRETLHLINAGKYASSIAVIVSQTFMVSFEGSVKRISVAQIFYLLKLICLSRFSVLDKHNVNFSDNPYFYLYFVCATISSTYTYTWDIKMDWGLFDFKDSEYKYLREEIVYSSPVSY